MRKECEWKEEERKEKEGQRRKGRNIVASRKEERKEKREIKKCHVRW